MMALKRLLDQNLRAETAQFLRGLGVGLESDNSHQGQDPDSPSIGNGTIGERSVPRQTRRTTTPGSAPQNATISPVSAACFEQSAINLATQSFCDGYYDGETLARYKPGFRLSPDAFLTGYLGKPFGFRADFLPNRHTMDQALAVSLVHDTATRGQPAAVDRAHAPAECTSADGPEGLVSCGALRYNGLPS